MSIYTIRTYEADPLGTLRLGSLMNLLEDAASQNASELGASVEDLHKNGITWVLSRMQIDLFQMPKFQDSVDIKTWPSGIDRFFTYRDFQVTSDSGEILLNATSTWVVLDMTQRKVIPIPQFIKDRKFVKSDVRLIGSGTKIKTNHSFDFAAEIKVMKSDLDRNNHTNNARYFSWILEPLPKHFDDYSIKSVDICFKSETYFGDELISKAVSVQEKATNHIILSKEDNKEVVIANIEFA
jgi:medium-chain acyl-[acyl-carrier-protein] hydrolase